MLMFQVRNSSVSHARRLLAKFGSLGDRSSRSVVQKKGRGNTQLLQDQRVRYILGLGLAGGGVVYISNLERVPVSGRLRFNIISETQEIETSRSLYEEILGQYQTRILGPNTKQSQLVKAVLSRLIPVSGLVDLDWEVYVIEDKEQKNAFVIPGFVSFGLAGSQLLTNISGKVFVFSGILDIATSDDAIAAVLAHELSHCIAHHAAERMSQMFIVIFAIHLAAFFFEAPDSLSRVAADLGFMKPASRRQEAEADYIGLMMMAKACYNPNEAITFWERMQKEAEYAPPQFLSTHPSNQTRIVKIREWLPEAIQEQQQSDCSSTLDYAQDFHDAFKQISW